MQPLRNFYVAHRNLSEIAVRKPHSCSDSKAHGKVLEIVLNSKHTPQTEQFKTESVSKPAEG